MFPIVTMSSPYYVNFVFPSLDDIVSIRKLFVLHSPGQGRLVLVTSLNNNSFAKNKKDYSLFINLTLLQVFELYKNVLS